VQYRLLGVALLGLELFGALQAYAVSTAAPRLAAELDVHEFRGLVFAAPQLALLMTLPLGAYLMGRFRAGRLLAVLVLISIFGSALSAMSESVPAFLAGAVVSGLASGVTAALSLAVMAAYLTGTWRRTTFIGYGAVWVLIYLIGPLYAGWV
jgi:MFS family permease